MAEVPLAVPPPPGTAGLALRRSETDPDRVNLIFVDEFGVQQGGAAIEFEDNAGIYAILPLGAGPAFRIGEANRIYTSY